MKARLDFTLFLIGIVIAATVVVVYFFTPSAATLLIFLPLFYLGMTTGLLVWLSGVAERRGRALSLMNWLLLGAAVVILIPCVAILFWGWTTAQVYNPAMSGGNRPAPMSLLAAREALIFPYLFALFLGLPLFAFWSIVCVIVTLVKRFNRGR